MKTLRIVTVCGMGFGTSLMLLMEIQDLAKKYNVNVVGEATDLGSYKGKECDLIVASSQIASQIDENEKDVVSIENMLDREEIENKMLKYFKE